MKKAATAVVAGTLLCAAGAYADPNDYVHTPTVEYGEKEIDFKYGSARSGNDPRDSAASIGFGYGATEWWFSEIYAKVRNENGGGTRYDAAEWENKFQLTETGKYPIDIGVLLELERPKNTDEGWEMLWGPLLQTEFGKVQLNANLLIRRDFHAAAPTTTDFVYEWQAKYRWLPQFELGFQGFGETGPWDRWAPIDQRGNNAGPAIFGKLALGNHQTLRYNAAWLIGTSPTTPGHTLRAQVEYEF